MNDTIETTPGAPRSTGAPSRDAGAVRRRDLFRLARTAVAAAPVLIATERLRAATSPPYSTDKTTDIIYMSATKLAGLLRSRQVSAVQAVEAFIERQLAINDMLNAVVMNSYARARQEAKALD